MDELRLALCALGAALLLEEDRRRGHLPSRDGGSGPRDALSLDRDTRITNSSRLARKPRSLFSKRASFEQMRKVPSPRSRKTEIKRKRRQWVQSWNQLRPTYGEHYPALGCEEGTPDFRHFTRMFPEQFDALVEKVAPIIHRRNTNFRASISVEERLIVTLHYLATGEGFKSLSHFFHMGNTTVRLFVPETLRAIYRVLKDKYVKCPETAKEWQGVARGFQSEWDFPNCVGALDGRLLNICPPFENAESTSPKEVSVALMALVDSKYMFKYIDVACNGKISNILCLVSFHPTGSDQLSPHCIVADRAFPLKEYLMKPYLHRSPSTEQQIFNYRLSRASRVAHDALNVLANRFYILQNTFNLNCYGVKIEDIVMACCALHNFLCVEKGQNNSSNLDGLCAYFMSRAGAVPSQYDIILD
uniref:DDE Tnp4 domain-containing protein n=1 Tax=Periophthalmus magnuspinnatus TaxID=409849 RepID=A0A3B3ZN97_9GOBI